MFPKSRLKRLDFFRKEESQRETTRKVGATEVDTDFSTEVDTDFSTEVDTDFSTEVDTHFSTEVLKK